MSNDKYTLSTSPHIRNDESIPKIMFGVVLSLIPATLIGIYFFGWDALRVVLICVLGAVFTEYLFQKSTGQKISIFDGSAVVTGLLLALNLPSSSPWWMVLFGAVIAIILGKQIFGGLGQNPFNPALVARVVLLISWPVQMTTWLKPTPLGSGLDAITAATPLGILKTEVLVSGKIGAAAQITLLDTFIGNIGGCIGEISAAALLIGGIYLLYKGYITWHIPVSFVATVAVISGLFWIINPDKYINPMFHILTGGLLLGAIFMATDMVTTPVTPKGMLIFGVGCGLITVIIRLFGGYPEGVSFSILLMNAVTPLIDRYVRPKRFGEVKANA